MKSVKKDKRKAKNEINVVLIMLAALALCTALFGMIMQDKKAVDENLGNEFLKIDTGRFSRKDNVEKEWQAAPASQTQGRPQYKVRQMPAVEVQKQAANSVPDLISQLSQNAKKKDALKKQREPDRVNQEQDQTVKNLESKGRQQTNDPEHQVIQSKDTNQQLSMKNNKNGTLTSSMQKGNGVHPKRILLFTMDSIDRYVEGSKKGGPAGEIIIRSALEKGLTALGFQVDTARSDAEFDRLGKKAKDYAVLILDPWTYAKKGWLPKDPLIGREKDVYILSFFGTKSLKNLQINIKTQVLTAFPTSPYNDFLGYFIDSSHLSNAATYSKKRQGVLWGKDPKYFKGKDKLIRALADVCTLHSTLKNPTIRHPNIIYHNHLDSAGWHKLLAESKFLLGLGDPLLGPSAVDAVSNGCVFINPKYSTPKQEFYYSQHPFVAESVGEPYVCNVDIQNIEKVVECTKKALDEDLPPLIPTELTEKAYFERLNKIFAKYL